jgi:hypothetical protein
LLVSVAAERAEEMVARAKSAGAESACIIGEVLPRGPHGLVID